MARPNPIIGLFTALCCSCLFVLPAMSAEEDGVDPPSAGVFGHDLVNKVKRGAVYIWMMQGIGPFGTLSPAGIGSGFIFQAVPEENAAYALTNHHVAGDTAILQVETWDRQTFKAELVATEPGIDVALIKIYNIPPDAYEVNVLGDSDRIQIGEPGLAIGAPGSRDSANTNRSDPYIDFGLHLTTTMRVVAGVQTEPYFYVGFWSGARDQLGYQVFTSLPKAFVCQSTINGGNSGGPLYNSRGEVIGLNHAHFGGNGSGPLSQNENYTIPINYAKTFAYQILNNGEYDLPWLGLDTVFPATFTQPQQITEFMERVYKPDEVKVFGVRSDSPAERAGFVSQDIILEFDGKVFSTPSELRRYVFDLPIGKLVPVRVLRGRQKIDLEVAVEPKRRYNSEFSI
jgi:S1-C subfamily serine protease